MLAKNHLKRPRTSDNAYKQFNLLYLYQNSAITYQVIEFLAAAKHISAELITIKTLRSEERSGEFCCGMVCWLSDLRVGDPSFPDDEESSS